MYLFIVWYVNSCTMGYKYIQYDIRIKLKLGHSGIIWNFKRNILYKKRDQSTLRQNGEWF